MSLTDKHKHEARQVTRWDEDYGDINIRLVAPKPVLDQVEALMALYASCSREFEYISLRDARPAFTQRLKKTAGSHVTKLNCLYGLRPYETRCIVDYTPPRSIQVLRFVAHIHYPEYGTWSFVFPPTSANDLHEIEGSQAMQLIPPHLLKD